MLMPDFSKYTLALYEGNKLICSSQDKGLRPLLDCLDKNRGKSGLILHDKVIGLAAARLIVYSGIIAQVITTVVSIPAEKYLKDNGIILRALEVAANIMTKDGKAICPGEVIAQNTQAKVDFFRKIKTMLGGQVS
jgi:hypothetical protein